MTVPSSYFSPPDPPACAEVLRIYRRICVLRVTGANDEAIRLESGDFSRALSAASSVNLSETFWAERFAAEEKRVTDAHLLAELLAPLLAEHLARTWNQAPRLPVPAHSFPSKSATRPRQVTAPLEVADFIEGMLAQERDETRQRADRRAS